MKLIILNITPNDSIKVCNYLRKSPVFFTKISSIGGIISNGSYTYLIKVSDELVELIFTFLVLQILTKFFIISSTNSSVNLGVTFDLTSCTFTLNTAALPAKCSW